MEQCCASSSLLGRSLRGNLVKLNTDPKALEFPNPTVSVWLKTLRPSTRPGEGQVLPRLGFGGVEINGPPPGSPTMWSTNNFAWD